MKDFFNKITGWWQKVSIQQSSYEKKTIKPTHDWTVIFMATQIVIIVCAVGAYYFYVNVDAGNFFAVTQDSVENEAKINIALLQKTASDIDVREKNFESTKGLDFAFPDPSK